MNKRTFLGLCALSAALIAPAISNAQDNTLRLIVPYPPGGTSDQAARILANELQPKLGTAVIVENIVGAGGRVAMAQIKKMPNDANVLVLVNPALMVIAPIVYSNIGYEPDTDFTPVSQVTRYEMGVAVSATHEAKSMADLNKWLKASGSKATFGVPATGSIPHFFAMMVAQAAGTDVPVVGYKGSAPLVNDLLGGHVPVAIDALDTLLPQHEGGKARILATSGGTRSVAGVPTLKEQGLNLEADGWNIFYAKNTMPADKLARYAKEISALMATPAVREKFVNLKMEPVTADREKTQATVNGFKSLWVPVIKKAGLKFD
ncbi:MAG: ABC transporter substrate-binding protein [Betaproteobacteria bacterium]|nr:MAG: ABC transporter substrate-binding protein [Betaproteobacteria bacterium]